ARDAWPGAFEPGAPGLRSLAAPLAKCLSALPPAPWIARMSQILERLHLADSDREGFEPDGLAAEVAASAPRVAGATADPWPLRKYLFNHDAAWRILAVDVRRDLAEVKSEVAPEVVDRWDRPVNNKPERFFELFLNACDPPRLAAVVSAKAADLKTLPPCPGGTTSARPRRSTTSATAMLGPSRSPRWRKADCSSSGTGSRDRRGVPAARTRRGLARSRAGG